MTLRCHAVLAPVSRSYPPPMDRSLRVTHPSATNPERFVRLACVKHAASVRSEPGSNSQVHPRSQPMARTQNKQIQSIRLPLQPLKPKAQAIKLETLKTHIQKTYENSIPIQENQIPRTNQASSLPRPSSKKPDRQDAANISLPSLSLFYCQRPRSQTRPPAQPGQRH